MKKLTNQHDIDIIIGKLLRVGVMTACAITVFGGIVFLFQHPGLVPNYKAIPGHHDIFKGAPEYLREFSTIIPSVFRLDGAAIVQLGLIVLIATPVLRVFFSLISFAIERDKMYVMITFVVLAIILLNMFFGLH